MTLSGIIFIIEYAYVSFILNISPMEILNKLSLSNYAEKQGERVAQVTPKRASRVNSSF